MQILFGCFMARALSQTASVTQIVRSLSAFLIPSNTSFPLELQKNLPDQSRFLFVELSPLAASRVLIYWHLDDPSMFTTTYTTKFVYYLHYKACECWLKMSLPPAGYALIGNQHRKTGLLSPSSRTANLDDAASSPLQEAHIMDVSSRILCLGGAFHDFWPLYGQLSDATHVRVCFCVPAWSRGGWGTALMHSIHDASRHGISHITWMPLAYHSTTWSGLLLLFPLDDSIAVLSTQILMV